MKKVSSIFLILIFMFFTVAPVLADETSQYNYTNDDSTPLTAGIEEDKIYLVPKSIFKLELESDLDINETKEKDEIFFRLVNPVKASNGMYLPEDTRFSGYFKKIKKSSPLYKRARGYIIVDKILMPNGQTYAVRIEPKSGSDLKAPQILNVIRAVPAGVGALAFSLIGIATIAIESVTVVGLVVVPRTCNCFGTLISSMSKGLNYKAKAGSTMKFKLDTPVYVQIDDLR
ncbi:hypothetical protein IKE67_01230 [bacterium]|nr:hypothetical protein [bacterium]